MAKLKQKILRTDCEKEQETTEFPNAEQLKVELQRIQTKRRFFSLLKSTIFTLIVVSAVAVLVAVFFMPVFRIYGSSMSPTLSEGEIVVSIKTDNIKCGDVVGKAQLYKNGRMIGSYDILAQSDIESVLPALEKQSLWSKIADIFN